MTYDNYYNEIENEIRAEFGDEAVSKPSRNSLNEWKDAIAKYNSLTDLEREALSAEVARRKGW
jgi:hypothetical protein